jgi:phenylpropionate dioxygenase-like ring-hydroxylating dioxygenase large terminal subunit
MLPKDQWYVAGWSEQLGPSGLVARRFLNEPVVLFRTAQGVLHAVEDRCSHRAMPLSAGEVVGDAIRCPYHGIEFDGRGTCLRIPSQDRIPPTAGIRSYPVVEQDDIIWIWMGDPALADPTAMPRHPWHRDPAWSSYYDYYHAECHWQLLMDNVFDLSHLAYIHPRTIGGDPAAHFGAQMETRLTEKGVMVDRRLPNCEPPVTYVAAKGFKGRIDRWQEIEFDPPVIRIWSGGCDVGTGAYEGKRDHGFSLLGLHAFTPETDRTSHYFWTMSTNILDPELAARIFHQTKVTIGEDIPVVKMQQQRIDDDPSRRLIDIASDAGGVQARRVIAALAEAEAKRAQSRAV